MMRGWRGWLYTLVGFENDGFFGYDLHFNFILSNGTRSTQRDEGLTYYDHFIPTDALNKIRSVYIFDWEGHIFGFKFFDKDGALLW